MSEALTHALIRVSIEVMDFVPLIHHVCHHLRWWFVHYRRRYNVRHVSKVAVLRYVQRWIRIEAAYGTEMNVAPENCHAD